MIPDMIVYGGTVVNAESRGRADVAIRRQKIVAVGRGLIDLAGARTTLIDARGRYVIPGAVDAHVHLEMECGDTTTSDDWRTGTRAAARGGVTTVIDFATPGRGESLEQAYRAMRARARDKACVDYACHLAITDWHRHGPELPRLVKLGCPTFKVYMTYASRGLMSDDGAVFSALEACRKLGAMLLVHAESDAVLEELIARHHTPALMRKFGARLHAMTRPNYIEAEAIQRAITWAEVTGGRLYVVHVSTGEGASLIRSARTRGVDVYAETCPQYLVLDDSVFSRPDGHLFISSPQVKKKRDAQRLWQAARSGEVSVVATDSCTFNRAQKNSWAGDWTRSPSGLPGTETMVPLLFTRGVQARRISLRRLVALCCANPARLMGLYPAKGAIAKGADADLVVIDPARKEKVDAARLETNADWSPYQGWTLAGFAETTICRGRIVVRDYAAVGEPGWGQWRFRRTPHRPLAATRGRPTT